MATAKTLPAANYTQDQVASLTADYNGGKGLSLDELAKKYGKTVPSIRAKLSSLKVYVSQAAKPVKKEAEVKGTKEVLADQLRLATGLPLDNIEASSKSSLVALLAFVAIKQKKIDSLIADIVGEDETLAEGDTSK